MAENLLLKETPYTEITATLEALASNGVRREHLDRIRANQIFARELSEIIKVGFIERANLIPSREVQIERWRQANQTGNFGIPEEAFASIPEMPELTEKDRQDGFIGVCLFYGFGNDNDEHANVLTSGELSWNYAKMVHKKNWISDYIKFKENWMRLCLEAWLRPKGFFWKKVHLGQNYQGKSVEDDRKLFPVGDTGASFEALQLAGILIPEYIPQMNGKDKPFWDMPDYDVAPYGDDAFYKSAYLYVVGDEFKLGHGHVTHESGFFGPVVLR